MASAAAPCAVLRRPALLSDGRDRRDRDGAGRPGAAETGRAGGGSDT